MELSSSPTTDGPAKALQMQSRAPAAVAAGHRTETWGWGAGPGALLGFHGANQQREGEDEGEGEARARAVRDTPFPSAVCALMVVQLGSLGPADSPVLPSLLFAADRSQ